MISVIFDNSKIQHMFWYHILDYFFLIFHTILTLFNLIGWIWKKTRMVNFITLMLTGFAWFGFGIFFGIGYCPLTDWHWDVLEKLGHHDLPNSYITYLIQRLSGITANPHAVEIATIVGFVIAVIMSVYLNFIRKRNNKRVV
jgi:hypothetical protein